MPLLVNLNEESYFSIKNDRQRLVNKIKQLTKEVEQLNGMLEEFDLAVERLKDFYEPKIDVKKDNLNPKLYAVYITIKHPELKGRLKVSLGNISDFESDKDEILLALAEKKGREALKRKYPLYFNL
jgi:hypothetical protein